MNHLEILKHYGIRAQKSLGQNFLVNDGILETIADSIEIEGNDILEIGPGYGALTEKILARKPRSLTLIELDKQMVNILNNRIHVRDLVIPKETAFRIVEGDVLKYVPGYSITPYSITPKNSQKWWNSCDVCVPQWGVLDSTMNTERKDGTGSSHFSEFFNYSVVANIPYYITSPILFRFLHELENKPDEMVILMQKEVGDKICEKKWYHHSYLSLALQYSSSTIEEICPVPKENFIPAPKVDSSVLYFKRKSEYDTADAARFLRVTGAGFSAPRKKVLSNLSNALHIPKDALSVHFSELGLLETARAEELGLETWQKLIEKLGE